MVNINRLQRLYRQNLDNESNYFNLRTGLAELAFDIAPKYHLNGYEFGNIPNLLSFMLEYAQTYTSNNFVIDLIDAIGKDFRDWY